MDQRYRTKYNMSMVENLYIGSSWAMQMGGVSGALSAAYQCAKMIK